MRCNIPDTARSRPAAKESVGAAAAAIGDAAGPATGAGAAVVVVGVADDVALRHADANDPTAANKHRSGTCGLAVKAGITPPRDRIVFAALAWPDRARDADFRSG